MKMPKKRKREKKTNYSTRLKILKSGLPRVVVRKTNKYIIVQQVSSSEAKDRVIVGITSKDLLKHGWPEKAKSSLKSVTAAYLTGYLAGKKILEKNKGKVILDIGLQRNLPGTRLYAVLKGLVDAGLDIPHDEKVFPNEERIQGKHLKQDFQNDFNKVREAIAK